MNKALKDLWSFAMMVFVILGIGGVLYSLFKEDGGLKQIFGALISAESRRSPVVLLPLVGLSLWIGWLALNGKLGSGKSGFFADLLVWVLALIGAYVAYKLVLG